MALLDTFKGLEVHILLAGGSKRMEMISSAAYFSGGRSYIGIVESLLSFKEVSNFNFFLARPIKGHACNTHSIRILYL